MSSSREQPRDAVDLEALDLENVRELAELMIQHDLTEVDVRHDGHRIRIRRGLALQAENRAPLVASPATSEAPAPAASVPSAEESANVAIIRSPMVGTFYNKPNPDADTYVRVGDHVGPDTTVCIIEAMKVFNEIAAEVSGKIIAVLVENEEAVEFGKPLFKVDTSG